MASEWDGDLEGWTDRQLVARLCAVDESHAARWLEDVGGLVGFARAGVGRLRDVSGMGRARTLRVCAAFEIAQRVRRRRLHRRLAKTPSDVAALVGPLAEELDVEQMWVLALDGASRVRALRRVAQGGRHGLVVSSREIYAVALAEAATAIVLAHNHPSGDPRPSAEDIAMTRVIAAAGRVVGIPLVDHVVVVSPDRFASLLEAGYLEPGDTPARASGGGSGLSPAAPGGRRSLAS